jgi:hypothetical protein
VAQLIINNEEIKGVWEEAKGSREDIRAFHEEVKVFENRSEALAKIQTKSVNPSRMLARRSLPPVR